MSQNEPEGTSLSTHVREGMTDRQQVEATADRIRDELLLTLEELDRRRERALNLGYQVMRHREQLLAAGGVGLLAAGVGLGVWAWRVRHREQLLTRRRRKALERAWRHPERVASRAKEPPLGLALGRRLVLGFLSALASAVARRAARELLAPRPPAPRPPAPLPARPSAVVVAH